MKDSRGKLARPRYYRLDVEADVSAAAAGFNMTARVGGTWKLTNLATGKVMLDDFITASSTATVGDAFIRQVERLGSLDL